MTKGELVLAKFDIKQVFKDIEFDKPERMLGKGVA